MRLRGVAVDQHVVALGRPIVRRERGSRIQIGQSVTLVSSSRDTALGVSRPVILRTLCSGAAIEIGADCGLSGTTICAVTSVSIGQRVLLGADVLIADTDFHVVDRLPRRFDAIPMARPDDAVVIEDDVFVGARAIVLKGVRIGHGSVIGAGSLVTEDVPPNVVAAGSPCKPIRSLRLQS